MKSGKQTTMTDARCKIRILIAKQIERAKSKALAMQNNFCVLYACCFEKVIAQVAGH